MPKMARHDGGRVHPRVALQSSDNESSYYRYYSSKFGFPLQGGEFFVAKGILNCESRRRARPRIQE
jgi:hypothetical protein